MFQYNLDRRVTLEFLVARSFSPSILPSHLPSSALLADTEAIAKSDVPIDDQSHKSSFKTSIHRFLCQLLINPRVLIVVIL